MYDAEDVHIAVTIQIVHLCECVCVLACSHHHRPPRTSGPTQSAYLGSII